MNLRFVAHKSKFVMFSIPFIWGMRMLSDLINLFKSKKNLSEDVENGTFSHAKNLLIFEQ